PQPTAEELVAIVAAVEALWPRPVVSSESQSPLRSPTWRFSGRWWATPSPARRARPFR
ncbi:MAG: hypothetical protein HY826_02390, partial [Actinobacteria bacterium]|nr:hypothetical protein [Actinomycetota bacterium]